MQLNENNGLLGIWPSKGLKGILDPENARIERFLEESLKLIKPNSRILDAGAGKCPYKKIFKDFHYESMDMPGGFYKNIHTFESHLSSMPVEDETYDVVVLTQVLEHVDNPKKVLLEINRVLKPNGILLLSVPLNGPIHGEPFHFFQFTHYGLAELAAQSNFYVQEIEKIGGGFWFIGKRLPSLFRSLMKSNDPFRAKKRNQNVLKTIVVFISLIPIWVFCYLPAAYIIRPVFYWLDILDSEKSLTTGYTSIFKKINEN